MAFVSAKNIEELKKRVTSAKSTLKNYREQAERTAETVMVMGETTGSAFLAGYARGRYADEETGKFEVMGAPPDLAGGVVMNLVGFAGALGRYDIHAHAIGNGMLSAYAAYKGLEIGAEHAIEDNRRPGIGPVETARQNAVPGSANTTKGALDTVGREVDSALVRDIRQKLHAV